MEIIEALQYVHDKIGGHSGASIPFLMSLTEKNINEVKTGLKTLYDSKKIKVREGINNKLIFLNNEK